MSRHFRPPSASTVIASIALIAALGGTSYAASRITGKDIKNNSVTGRDIKNSSLTTGDIKNGSLRSKDFKKGEIPAGPQGPAGPSGPAGRAGADAFGSLSYVAGDEVEVGPNEEGYAEVLCPDGLLPTGGGAYNTALPDDGTDPPPARDININSSFPITDGADSGWGVFVENNTPDTQYATATAVCAPATTTSGSRLKRARRR